MSEDLFEDSQDKITLEDYEDAVSFICENETEHDGTTICFEMFEEIIGSSIYKKPFDLDLKKLDVMGECVRKLREVNAFNNVIFSKCLLDMYLHIPLELVWWLKKQGIFTFAEFWNERRPDDLMGDIIGLVETTDKNLTLVKDLLDELLCGAYGARLGICRLRKSKIWRDYCRGVLHKLMKITFDIAARNEQNTLFNYLKNFSIGKKIYFSAYKCFFGDMLTKLLTTAPDELDMEEAYKYQYLFTYETLNDNTRLLLDTMFSYISINSLFSNLEDQEAINWKYFLYSISVCVRNHKNAFKILEGHACRFLDNTFKGGKIKELMKAFILIRHGTMEKSLNKNYKAWYCDKFGIDTTYKTSINGTFFKYFVECLIKFIPIEPKQTLNNHIRSALRAPKGLNSMIFDFKSLCNQRLPELKEAHIVMHEMKVPIIHLIEDCQKKGRITPFVEDIISRREYKQKIVNELENDRYSVAVRELFKEHRALKGYVGKKVRWRKSCFSSDDLSDFADPL